MRVRGNGEGSDRRGETRKGKELYRTIRRFFSVLHHKRVAALCTYAYTRAVEVQLSSLGFSSMHRYVNQ